jgi:hypothetical protein
MIVQPMAESLFVPTDSLHLSDAPWPIEPLATHLALGVLGVALVLVPSRIRFRRPAGARPYVLSQSQMS